MKFFRVSLHLLLSCLLVLICASGVFASILTTKHNLSVSGPGTITATTENRVCIFCHTPHHATSVTPLWSRKNSNAIYDLYASSSLVAQPGQPTGGSRLCLSCHDGTIAIGMLDGLVEPIAMTGGITTMPIGSTNLETDLSNDHPISFAYTSTLAAQKGELLDPALLPQEIRLEDGNMLQCTSCHDPHDDPHGMFLVMSNAGSALCISCHDKTGWALGSHATDPAVSVDACLSCHQSHGAPGAKHLLQSSVEEANCLANCHNSVGVGIDIQTDSNKFYSHPVNLATGVHDITENPLTMSKHVECSDCHNPHQVSSQGAPLASPPDVNGRLTGVKGISSTGAVLTESTYEYEICFGCHAENAFYGNQLPTRLIQEQNERLRFDSANPSFHPVTAVGKNLNVPSLRPEYTEASQIYCTDCHGSDSSTRAGGIGADGPHGSIYPHILIARYEQDIYPLTYSVSNYDLCFRCHDPDALFNPMISTFHNGHRLHVQMKGVSCSVCHDPHGVPVTRGATVSANAHLINFDSRFVDPSTAVYDSVTGSCTVSCHQMNPRSH
ncbi:doubled CXXCH domain-containing protein [Malonomonas rubra DSM 5091]|uniref:nitrite reductase (cytochrome; ammonia-forming) n=1 Tax=Malonomonas rubra DSM 5091 TaxID=1122189 RepID=A0A1M6DV46_MALRU|nr:cytochrome c3 family protein [Malonomonas rubra]SHI77000.1 doubled CXXCH domain-containing protein [Malonomonas rubra DSM 5091]